MQNTQHNLPQVLADCITALSKSAGYSKSVQLDVYGELETHFADALADLDPADAQKCAEELIESFGDPKMLAKLIKKGKKRCRPLWQKVLCRTLLCVGALLMVCVLYSLWFFTGRPTFSVNYLTKLNDIARPAAFDPDLNAWPYYEKAVELYVAPDDDLHSRVGKTAGKDEYVSFSALDPAEQSAISAWVARNTDAWDQYEIASMKPYCYRKYDVGEDEDKDKPMLIAVLLPHLSELRDIARLGAWRAEMQLVDNKSVDAMQTCLTLVRVGKQWYVDRATLIEQLVAQAIVSTGEEMMLRVIAGGGLSIEQARTIRNQLEEIFPDEYPHMTAIEMEGMMFEDTVQHTFTKGGPGGGHIIPKMFTQIGGLSSEVEQWAIGLSVLHVGRDKTLEVADKLYEHLARTVKMSPYQRRVSNIQTTDEFLAPYSEVRYAFLWSLAPALDRVSTIRYEGKALHDATLTILSLRQCQLEKGQLPDTLDELVQSGYSKTLVDDPFSKDSLVYRKTGNDYQLYSLGEDFDDDNGQENPNDPWGRNDTGGDHVFWPVR